MLKKSLSLTQKSSKKSITIYHELPRKNALVILNFSRLSAPSLFLDAALLPRMVVVIRALIVAYSFCILFVHVVLNVNIHKNVSNVKLIKRWKSSVKVWILCARNVLNVHVLKNWKSSGKVWILLIWKVQKRLRYCLDCMKTE